MGKLGIAFAMILSLFSGSAFAQSQVSGKVTVLYAPPGQAYDSRKCTFFQMNGGKNWYAIPFNDPGYESELILLRDSFLSGQTLTFVTEAIATTCGWFPAYDLYMGTPG